MPEPQSFARALVEAFERIRHERMADVPILNERIPVEVVGGRDWNGHWLGVLVTPWFISLVLMPLAEDAVAALAAKALGETARHDFPAGSFDFLVGEEAGLGRFAMCSLFSPVLEFEDHEAARVAGEAALSALFNAGIDGEPEQANSPDESKPSLSRRGFLIGRGSGEGGEA